MKCFKFENNNESCNQWQYDKEFVSIKSEVINFCNSKKKYLKKTNKC
jgi:hypothetical protein